MAVTTAMQKYGNSYAIHVPKEIIDEVPFMPDELLDMTVSGNRVIIKNKK